MKTAPSAACTAHVDVGRRERRTFSQVVRRLWPVAVAAGTAIGFLLTPVAPASATPGPPLVALPDASPFLASEFGAKPEGPAPPSAPLSLQVYFHPTNSVQLASLASAVSTPGTSSYHHFLSVSQFAARFGPSKQVVSALDKYLRSRGLSVGQLSANRLALSVTGTSAQFQGAFGAQLLRFRTAGGAQVIGSTSGPKLPADLASSVAYVDGLDPWVAPFSNLVRAPSRQIDGSAQLKNALLERASAPGNGGLAHGSNHQVEVGAGAKARPAREATAQSSARTGAQTSAQTGSACAGMANQGLTPAQLDGIYGLDGFDQRGIEGQGETIGLIEYGLADLHAVAGYQACTGSSLSIDYVPTSAPPTQIDTEVAADIEVIAALAPKATVVVYEASQQGTDLAPWDMAVSGTGPGGLPDVISDSWGMCEQATGLTSAYYQVEEGLYEEAAAQGQTIVVASGDDGSEGCLDQTQSKEFAVNDPATAPFVTAVGGTASDTTTGPQYIWNSRKALARQCLDTQCDLYGASGGGASTVWPRPTYQPASLPQSPSCTLGAQGCREIPDVSALAGDAYGQYCSPTLCGGGGNWVGFGGTSVAAPSWGAAVLLSDEICPTKVGFLNPLLYEEPSLLTSPIRSGNNDLTGSHDGMFEASLSGGYSMAGGLGYLGGIDLSSGVLCGAGGATGGGGGAPGTTGDAGSPASASTGPTTSTTVPGAGSPSTAGSPSGGLNCADPANAPVAGNPVALAPTADSNDCSGYLVVTASGAVSGFAAAITYGSLQGRKLKTPVVGVAVTPDSQGYWLLTSGGQIFAFGDARSYGAPPNLAQNTSAVGISATPDGKGYWLVTRNGAVYAFGDAKLYGSLLGQRLNQPVVGMVATPTGNGYWLAAADGGVFGFGGALYHGSLAGKHLKSRVVGITTDADGTGYFLATSNGDIFSFGARFYGSGGANPPPDPVVAVAPSLDRRGYYLIDSGGQVYAYGDAIYGGNATKPVKPKKH
jgi:Pro-kumamolisin, activation domain